MKVKTFSYYLSFSEKKMGWESIDWPNLTQDRNQQGVLGNAIMILRLRKRRVISLVTERLHASQQGFRSTELKRCKRKFFLQYMKNYRLDRTSVTSSSNMQPVELN
jgi:hypothetical protein